jgi:hypothetical protein
MQIKSEPGSENELTLHEASACRTPLFQGVNCLSIFVASNQGGEETTRIGKIVVSGGTVAGMDVNAIKKPDEDG